MKIGCRFYHPGNEAFYPGILIGFVGDQMMRAIIAHGEGFRRLHLAQLQHVELDQMWYLNDLEPELFFELGKIQELLKNLGK